MERFQRGVRNVLGPQTLYHKTFQLSNLQTFYPAADDITDIMVCQVISNLKTP